MHARALAATLLAPGDALLAISRSGHPAELIASVELGREAGADVVAITPPRSPLAGRCTGPLAFSADDATSVQAPLATRLAQLTVVDVLAIGIAPRPGPQLASRIERARDSLRGRHIDTTD